MVSINVQSMYKESNFYFDNISLARLKIRTNKDLFEELLVNLRSIKFGKLINTWLQQRRKIEIHNLQLC